MKNNHKIKISFSNIGLHYPYDMLAKLFYKYKITFVSIELKNDEVIILFKDNENYIKAFKEVCLIPIEHKILEIDNDSENIYNDSENIYNDSEKYIIDTIHSEYKEYPELKEYEERIIKMYLKEYTHISENKNYFNINGEDEEQQILNLTFKKLNEIWSNIFQTTEKQNEFVD